MSILGPEPGGSGLQFRIGPFPISIHPSFLLVAAILGLVPGATVGTIAIWTAVVIVSVIVHELGHAVVARRLGAEPVIDLYGLGGLTRSSFTRPLQRLQAITLSLAGPFAGFALGAVVFGLSRLVGELDSELGQFAIDVVIWVNIGWGAINLLPVLPLDGGHVLTNLLPGDDETRVRRGAWVSMATAAMAAVALLSQQYIFGAMVFGFLVASNLSTIRSQDNLDRRQAERTAASALLERWQRGDPGAEAELLELASTAADTGLGAGITMAVIEERALAGRTGEAQQLMADATVSLPPSLHALVSVCATDGVHGLTELVEIAEAQPTAVSAHHLVLGAVRAGRPEVAGATFASTPGLRDARVLLAARATAAQTGSPVLVGALAALKPTPTKSSDA